MVISHNVPVIEKPFDFAMVKIIIKKGTGEEQAVYLDKKWTIENLEHFKPVIEGVGDEEGIEITLTCNLEAFQFIVRLLKETDYDKKCAMMDEINHNNVLNIIVTSEFLKLDNIYEMAWNEYLLPNFVSVIDTCKLDLS